MVMLFIASQGHAALFSATLPSSRSVQVGQVGSFFATVVSSNPATVTNCSVALATPLDAVFTYQTTDALTNEPTGTPNTPVDIPPMGAQSFVLTLNANTPISATQVSFTFNCDNDGPAAVVPGLNTLLFSASATPIPDIIALAATVGGTGIVELPQDNGLGFFTVATNNIGVSGSIDVTARVGDSSVSADQLLLCQTDLLGACLSPAVGPSLTLTIDAGATPTFAVFAANGDEVPFDPGANRLFLDFAQAGEPRGSTNVAFRGGGYTAAGLFEASVSPVSVQGRCVGCHVSGGIAGNTRLIFQVGSDQGTLDNNLTQFENFLETVPDGANRILQKVQGALAHGGGVQISAGTDEFDDLAQFLDLLGGEVNTGVNPQNLFSTVTLAPLEKTLRIASLLFAGRVPTAAELDSVRQGDEAQLRTTVRGLMQGDAFHRFLLEGANDRLLTDRQIEQDVIDPNTAFFVNHTQRDHELLSAAYATSPMFNFSDEWIEYFQWRRSSDYGFARAPLELIAYVVENDRPYTEILTADYVMANPLANEAYGGSGVYADSTDQNEFQPTQIVDYYRTDSSKITNFSLETNTEIVDPGNLSTPNYPHAGILTTNAFNVRYPSTSTNRNRARARWTFYHFLGFDIEKSAARTQDPDDLADTNNPTLNNPACTVCHEIMDPVAGAFQNFGDAGFYRDSYFGMDSLDRFYKYPEGGGDTPYQWGDTWYRDMRNPGFEGTDVPNADNSLAWLAQQIVADPRFASAAVRFWWPAVMGTEALEAPESETDPDYEADLLAFSAQNLQIDELAQGFADGFDNGPAYNLKDLLVEMVMSPWFRAQADSSGDPLRETALASAGMERLLTPEQLNRKTLAVTGLQWGGFVSRTFGYETPSGPLLDAYRLYYGGIDSNGVVARAESMNALMSSVSQSHGVEMSCPLVMREFLLLPDGDRRLFGGINRTVTPQNGEAQIRDKLVELSLAFYGESRLSNDAEIDRLYDLFNEVWTRKSTDPQRSYFFPGDITCDWWAHAHFFDGVLTDPYVQDRFQNSTFDTALVEPVVSGFDYSDSQQVLQTWVVVVAAMLSDYQFLHY